MTNIIQDLELRMTVRLYKDKYGHKRLLIQGKAKNGGTFHSSCSNTLPVNGFDDFKYSFELIEWMQYAFGSSIVKGIETIDADYFNKEAEERRKEHDRRLRDAYIYPTEIKSPN